MSEKLANYVSGKWILGTGEGVALFDPVLGNELVRVDASGIDLAAAFEFSRETNQKLLDEGFVYNYGKTNPENDFNTYAELLFTDPQKFKSFANSSSLVRKKLNYLKNIYRNAGYTGKFPDET